MKKTVLITGASRGIGEALAVQFAKSGCNLVLTCSKTAAALEKIAQNLRSTWQVDVLTSTGDVSDPSYMNELFFHSAERFGGIDILINNAGISYIGLLSEMSFEDWNHLLNVNLTSVFLASKLAIPHMLHQKDGVIINISSVWGLTGASCEAAYSATKGGVNALTKALAKELAPSNIRVNAIACGVIDTQMNACFSEEERNALIEEIPAGRFGDAKEVADLALSLSEANSYLTGQIITLDGGWI